MNIREVFINAQSVRNQLITPGDNEQFPDMSLSAAYIWPTKFCPNECGHCMYGSPSSEKRSPENVLFPEEVDSIIDISDKGNLDFMVVSGGGEPTLEMKTNIRLLSEGTYNHFELNTGGNWLKTEKSTRKILDTLQTAINDKNKNGTKIDFGLRISIDKFHQEKVPIIWIARLIEILKNDRSYSVKERQYPDINLYFRTILLEGESTVQELARLTEAKVNQLDHSITELQYNSGSMPMSFIVFYKDMNYIGRGASITESPIGSIDETIQRLSDSDSNLRLPRAYSNPRLNAHTSGLDVFITYKGEIFPYGGVVDVYGDLHTDSYADVVRKLWSDIITRTILKEGVDKIVEYASEVDREIQDRVLRKNWIPALTDESLRTDILRLYVTIRLLQKEIKEGRIKFEYYPDYIQKILSVDPSQLKDAYFFAQENKPTVVYEYGNQYLKQSKTGNG